MQRYLKTVAVGLGASGLFAVLRVYVRSVTDPGYGREAFIASLLALPILAVASSIASVAWARGRPRIGLFILSSPATYWATYDFVARGAVAGSYHSYDLTIAAAVWTTSALLGAPCYLLCSKWLARRDPPYKCCQRCGYNLTGNVSGRCPECGQSC